ncbi:MAG TPA: hypothetical protein VLH86_05380 [Patescibacteria group bacterium]|nr:hypothetical protein [Patescibacteria group bacterium]
MKRTLSTIVLFVLLILTVVALRQLGTTQSTSALRLDNATATVRNENHR